MNNEKFKGLFPAQLVPFGDDNTIVEESLRKLLNINLEKGVKGFYICGSTGESFLMSLDERRQTLEIVKDEVGDKCTLIAHVGTISTDRTIDLARHAEKVGVDAISAVAPFYYRFRKREILEHYKAIVAAVDVPMIVYNIPGNSGVILTLADIKQLLELDHVVGFKHSSSDLYQMDRIKQLAPETVVLFGSDEMLLGASAMGADGGVGSTYNLMAEKYLKIRRLFAEGKSDEAREEQVIVNHVVETMLDVGLYAALKYGISRLGIPYGVPRLPFLPLTDEGKRRMDKAIEEWL